VTVTTTFKSHTQSYAYVREYAPNLYRAVPPFCRSFFSLDTHTLDRR